MHCDPHELIGAVAVASHCIRLIDRVTPLNARRDLQRLAEGWTAGGTPTPEPEYLPPLDPTELLAALDGLIELTSSWDLPDRLVTARLEELHADARLGASVGTPHFGALALQRYAVPSTLGTQADQLADSWIDLHAPPDAETHVSDDERDPSSLHCQIQGRLEHHGLPWRVVADARGPALANVAPPVVRYRQGVRLAASFARALAVHEVDGHAVPHALGCNQTLLLARVGSANGMEDQEGRAVVLEEKFAELPALRRQNLACRHLAARSCRQGATYIDCVRALIERGSSCAQATHAAYRVYRGGGLAREIVYLPGYLTFRALEHSEPGQAAWMNAGAISFEAARVLESLGLTPHAPGDSP